MKKKNSDPRIKRVTAKGRVYLYHRATGERIRAEPGSEDFRQELDRLDRKAQSLERGNTTLGQLCRAYLASPEFQAKAQRTRLDYREVLHRLEPLYELPATKFDSAFTLKLRDKVFNKSGRRMANYVLQVLSLIFTWGLPRGYVKTNTIKGIPKVPRPKDARKVNRPWEIEEFRTVLREAKGGLKRAIALGGFAGVSEADVRSLTLEDNIKQVTIIQKSKMVRVTLLEYVRQKTDTPVSQTLHPELAEILAPVKSGLLVTGRKGRAYTENGFQSSFFKLIRKLSKEKKVKPGLTFHGLRHFVATKLADEGADAKTIASVLGQKTVQMAEHYSEQFDRKKRARAGAEILSLALSREQKEKKG
jgi:integrase